MSTLLLFFADEETPVTPDTPLSTITGWRTTLSLSVTIDGTIVGSTSAGTLVSAQFGMGRGDWFDSLSTSTATFTFAGSLSELLEGGPLSPTLYGGQITVTVGAVDLWTGYVDTIDESDDVDHPGHTTSTFTAMDGVSRWAQYQIPDILLLSGDIGGQLSQVLMSLGPTIDARPNGRTWATMASINPLSGSALDWISDAETWSNAIIAPSGTGSIVIVDRGHFADYGDRVESSYYADPPTSLWRMDEGSGNIADSIGGFTGTAAGTPVYHNTGAWDSLGPRSIGFQKADAADQFTFGDVFDLTGGSFNIMGWLYWFGDASSRNYILYKASAGPNGWTLAVNTSSKLEFLSFNAGATGTNVVSLATIPTNTWTHFAISANGGTVRIILNGELDNSGALGPIPNTAATLRMGGDNASSWFGGRLQMVSIDNGHALTAAEVRSLITMDAVTLDGDLSPYTWSKKTAVTTVIDHWLFRQPGLTEYTDTTAIDRYGDHSFEVTAAAGTTSLSTSYSSAMRSALLLPRPTVTADFHVAGDAQLDIVTLEPMDIVVGYDGLTWQVMSVQHQIGIDTWDINVQLSGTVADLTTGENVLAT